MWERFHVSPWVLFSLKEKYNHFSQTLVLSTVLVINCLWYNLITGPSITNSMSSRYTQGADKWKMVRKWCWRSSLTLFVQTLNHNFWSLYHTRQAKLATINSEFWSCLIISPFPPRKSFTPLQATCLLPLCSHCTCYSTFLLIWWLPRFQSVHSKVLETHLCISTPVCLIHLFIPCAYTVPTYSRCILVVRIVVSHQKKESFFYQQGLSHHHTAQLVLLLNIKYKGYCPSTICTFLFQLSWDTFGSPFLSPSLVLLNLSMPQSHQHSVVYCTAISSSPENSKRVSDSKYT